MVHYVPLEETGIAQNLKMIIYAFGVFGCAVNGTVFYFIAVLEVLQQYPAFIHGVSTGDAVIHHQYFADAGHIESLAALSCLIDMSVAERIYVRDRQVQIERQQIGREHAAAGHADDEVEIPWQNAEMLQDAMVQVIYITIVHVVLSFRNLSIMSYIFFTLCPQLWVSAKAMRCLASSL